MNEKKARNYLFTIPNYTKKNLKDFNLVATSLEKHNYICYGLEISEETKLKHIQGYIQLKNPQRFLFLHDYFNLKRKGSLLKFHIEEVRGSLEDNQEYTKKGGDWYEFGEPKAQGRRKDIELVREQIKQNPKELKKIVYENNIGYQAMKFAENFQKYCFEDRNPKEKPKVIWLYGTSGIGKTRLVFESFESICSVSDYAWLGHNYQQQECYLLDDFRNGDLSFNMLLKITDRYPLSLANKGSFVPLNSPYIVITTTHSIKDTFDFLNEDLNQLKRRVIEVDLNRNDIKDLKKDIDFTTLQDF